MASVNIPFNLDAKQTGEQDQNLNQRALTSFYAYQDPRSGLMPQTLITNERESEEICFKRFLLLLIISLSFVTLVKSCTINCIKLSRNIALNFQLKKYQKNLKIEKNKIEAKIKANSSYQGMRKIIHEEIKALDANEILVRFEK
jgi:hypothetical protein